MEENGVKNKMQAIILAAGMGKRLKYLTNDNTKCMVKVNGVTVIERALTILDKKHLSRIVIVVGYEGQKWFFVFVVFFSLVIGFGSCASNKSSRAMRKAGDF